MAKLRAPGNFVYSPLLDAAGRGDVARVKSLLEQGAHPNTRDGDLNTPMLLAVIGGTDSTHDVIEALAAAKADINAENREGRTPLMVAALNYRHNTVELLMRLGADPEHKDANGKTVLDILQQRYNETLKKERTFFAITTIAPIMDRLKYWIEVRKLNDVLTPDILKPSPPKAPRP